MAEVSLSEILDARESRAALQKELSEKYGSALISFTMNIAGPTKSSPLIIRAFRMGIRYLEASLPASKILFSTVDEAKTTGPYAVYAIKEDALWLKRICTEAEESTELGRLYDMDVIDTNFTKLSRECERGCIVCGAKGRACAAGRVHPVSEIQAKMNRIMTEAVFNEDTEIISKFAVDSLVKEVETTPKPGLVDLRNNGSHADMNVKLFKDSAYSLKNYFRESIEIGRSCAALSYSDLFSKLRQAGLSAEKCMYAATNGVNTHKGVIFSYGILCGAIGRLWTPKQPICALDLLSKEAANIARVALIEDFAAPKGVTAGERMFINHGATGIRGEAASGFSSVFDVALPTYRMLRDSGLDENYSGVITLLNLIVKTEDTTAYNRGGEDGLSFAKKYAKELLKETPQLKINQVEEMDDEFIKRNLSAGGSADLLAITYFIDSLEGSFLK